MKYYELMCELSARGRAVYDAIERVAEPPYYNFSSPTEESEFLPLLETLSERDLTIILELQLHVAEAYEAIADVVAESGEWDPDEFFRPEKFCRVDEDGEDTTP